MEIGIGGSTGRGAGVWVEKFFTICIMNQAHFIIEVGAGVLIAGPVGGGI
jgi:hypothetical protein